MRYFERCPLISVAALASYLAVHIFAGVLHHHEVGNQPGTTQTASNEILQVRATSPQDNDGEDNCALCSVLHLAQMVPTAFQVEAVALLSGEQLSAAALIRPHPVETATHTRGPPLI